MMAGVSDDGPTVGDFRDAYERGRSGVTTLTLTDFLLARIAEDEAEADAMMQRYREGGDVTSRRWRRVLAECEAKRRIVARHRPFSHGRCQACYSIEAQDEWSANLWPCPDLRDLALPYADHPDYREEWRP